MRPCEYSPLYNHDNGQLLPSALAWLVNELAGDWCDSEDVAEP